MKIQRIADDDGFSFLCMEFNIGRKNDWIV